MSREDAELVRHAFEVIAADGPARGFELYLADDAEYSEDPIWPEASTYRGREAITGAFDGYIEALGAERDWSITIEDVVDAGDHQVALVRIASSGTASGVPHEHLWAYVVRVSDGRLASVRAYYDADEALTAARG